MASAQKVSFGRLVAGLGLAKRGSAFKVTPMEDISRTLAEAYLAGLGPLKKRALTTALETGAPLPGFSSGSDTSALRAALSEALASATAAPDLLSQITELLAQDRADAALGLVDTVGGAFLSMTLGLDQARAIAAAFPDRLRAQNATLELLDAVNALKSGNLTRADQVLGRQARLDPSSWEDTDLPRICVLYMKAVYEDEPISDTALTALSDVLARLPGEEALLHGLLHNVGLDVFMRQGQRSLAEEAALRALHHYSVAGMPGLAFYVRLYLAVLALDRGEPARAALENARADLDAFAGASDNDRLLWRSFDLIARYETGEVEPLVRHLTQDQEVIPYGELWPAMAAPILAYGRRALAASVSPAIALAWVRKWRLRQWRSRRFDQMISVQEAAALQAAGRWQEADELLALVTLPEGGEADLPRFAAALDRAPGSEELGRKLRLAAGRVDPPIRHRVALNLLAARSAAGRQAGSEAARLLGQMLSLAPPEQLPMIWQEVVGDLIALRRTRLVRDELSRQPRLRRALAAIIKAGRDEDIPDALTPREYRVLLLLGEGAPNKTIAQRLGISLPTVKFHVGNLARKAGTRRRQSIVSQARDLGWLK